MAKPAYFSRHIVLAGSILFGVLLALGIHIIIQRFDLNLADLWKSDAPGLIPARAALAWWLIAAASSPKAYAGIGAFMSSFFGRLILFGYTWALMHHMLGGIRHLIWDTGRGFGPQEREWMALASLIGSISLTIVIWIVGYLFMGGPR